MDSTALHTLHGNVLQRSGLYCRTPWSSWWPIQPQSGYTANVASLECCKQQGNGYFSQFNCAVTIVHWCFKLCVIAHKWWFSATCQHCLVLQCIAVQANLYSLPKVADLYFLVKMSTVSRCYEIKVLLRTILNDGIAMKKILLFMIHSEDNGAKYGGSCRYWVSWVLGRVCMISSAPDIVWETIFHTRGR